MKKNTLFLLCLLILVACRSAVSIHSDDIVDIYGQVAFCGKKNGDMRYDIYLLDLPSREIKNLTGEYVNKIDNAFGHSIGCDTNLIPYKITGLEWSPLGDLLILNAGGPYLTIPYVMNISPAGKVLDIVQQWSRSPLSISPFERPEEFSWSPNGDKVAFVGVNTPEGYQNLFVGNVNNWKNGSVPFEIVQSTHVEIDWPGIIYSPKWSPDGKNIAVTINRHSSGVAIISADGKTSVFVTNENHSQLSEIENPTNPWINATPSWFPDGKSLIFVAATSNKSRTALFSVTADGTNLKLLVPDGVQSPVVSPNGNHIAYIEYSRKYDPFLIGRIIRVDANGENRTILATIKKDTFTPFYKYYIRDLSWSPDGSFLIFVTNQNNQFQLYMVSNDGQQVSRVTSFSGDAVNPKWRPNHP